MNANAKDAEQSMDVCANVNSNIKLLIFFIIIIILVISLFILILNILSYILFTIYCISDNATLYMAENPDSIPLGETYKYRLLNYVKNSDYKPPKEGDTYKSFVKCDFDSGASDLYIHKTMVYYNYIVKLMLLITFLLVIGVLYNVYIKLTSWASGCDEPSAVCEFILVGIFSNDTYIYYIILILFAYILIHSYVYTVFFNKSIYWDLYAIYAVDYSADQKNKYKNADTVVYDSINNIKIKGAPESQYLKSLKDISFNELVFKRFLSDDNQLLPDYDDKYKNLLNYGIETNNKFVIPSVFKDEYGGEEGEVYDYEDDFNEVLKDICKRDGISTAEGVVVDASTQKLLADKIFIYLIYHYVITNNIEDPFIIHKLNNIYLDLYTNIQNHLLNKATKSEKQEYNDDFLERFSIYIKKMYKDIKCSYTIKLLLPIGAKKENVLKDLHSNASDLLKLLSKRFVEEEAGTGNAGKIDKYKIVEDSLKGYTGDNKRYSEPAYKKDVMLDTDPLLYTLKYNISKKIRDFADNGFADYYQEDKTPSDISRIVYKINFYLAVDMLQTVLFILVVLLILYKSTKFPYLELYINMAVTYVIIIINEVISAILGIV